MQFRNCYDDEGYAAAYAKLEFPGTYYLAFRDLPGILSPAAHGTRALDFGCGAGRSTLSRPARFPCCGRGRCRRNGPARDSIDPIGDYRLVADGDLSTFANGCFDVILSAFTFDNVPGRQKKVALFSELRRP